MTVTSELSAVERSWTGVETVFDTGFKADDATHCRVSVGTTVLTRGTQYTSQLTLAGILQILPLPGMPAAPATLLIERVTPATQENDLVNGDGWDMELLERQLDRTAMRDAESRRTSGLAFGQAAQALAAAQAALAAVVSAVAGVSFFNGRSGNVVPEAGDYTAAQVTNAARTNGTNTFTGNQTITKSSPVLALNKTAVAQFASLRGSLNDVLRWDVPLGNDTAEAGSNAGSDFEIASYTDLGAGRAVRARIRRADGYANLFGSLEIGTPGGNNTLLLRRLGTSIGGAADLELPSTGSTLAGNVRQQLTANQWQLIENGGTQRGVRLDLTGCAAAAGSDLVHSGNFATQLAAVLGPALAALAHTDVGIFGFFRETSVTTAAPGTVVSGSGLNWTAVNDATNSVGASPTGQWRRHGQGFSGGCCVFQRWS